MPSRLLLFLILTATSLSVAGQAQLAAAVPGRFIVSYRNSIVPADAAASAAVAGARLVARHDHLGISILEAPAASASAVRGRLASQPAVASIVQDRVVSAHAITVKPAAASVTADPDALYHSQQGWAVRQVGGFGPDATDLSRSGPWNITEGKGVRIAILDSGMDASHPDLAPNLALNLSEIDQTALPSVCDDGTPQDQQGHGTWTASLAAGAIGAGTGLIAGVAPEATLLNIKVLERLPGAPTAADSSGCSTGQASGLLSWVLQGIDDAIANHADIISMSLGAMVDITTGDGAGLQATFNHATHAAFSAGIVLIAAAGNDGFSFANQQYIELPAQSRDVVAIVASTNPACRENLASTASCTPGPITLPYYSNFGAPLNALAAPGGSYPAGPTADPTQPTGWILAACSSGKPNTVSGPPADAAHSMGCFGLGHTAYVQAMGTSASAPLAAGVAALILAAHPTWNATTVVDVLRSTASTIPGLPAPQVNAAAAIVPAVHTTHNLAPGKAY